MSGLVVLGAIAAIILVFNALVVAFGKDSRPEIGDVQLPGLSL